MATHEQKALSDFFYQYQIHPAVSELQDKLNTHPQELIEIYHAAIPLLEQEIWREHGNEQSVELYQALCRELEIHIMQKPHDERFNFVIVIPVADRPQHLEACLHSLLQLCHHFNYGGTRNGRYNKVSVIIADDSRETQNITRNQQIACHFTQQGIEVDYFGLVQQLALIDSLSENDRNKLDSILGHIDRRAFYHKGPSIMRNITYLKLREISKQNNKILLYFIDSDQEFRIKLQTPAGDRDLYALNYFYHLDRIFNTTHSMILTGKVVGDPPVSPAVMAGNFLGDVISFLQQMAGLDPAGPCAFHDHSQHRSNDAAYHDMAGMFGFKPAKESFRYLCPLGGEHDNAHCFANFARNINSFFYGEHPTRKTYFEPKEIMSSIVPARTIYTGNYIFRPEALKYFIPFATLRLRMAGPVMGRIIKSEIPDKFISANLPMLHKRTIHDSGQSEFRPGINRQQQLIDLSGEFERQYFGDVMLFTIEKLAAMGYPDKQLTPEEITEILNTTELNIQQQYLVKHREILEKLGMLNSLLNNSLPWWQHDTSLQPAMLAFHHFADSINHNYGEHACCYEIIKSDSAKQQRLVHIKQAITHYADDRKAWELHYKDNNTAH